MEICQKILVKILFLLMVKRVFLQGFNFNFLNRTHKELFLEQMKAEEALHQKFHKIGSQPLKTEEALLQRVQKLADFQLLLHLETRLMYKLDLIKAKKMKELNSFWNSLMHKYHRKQ